VAAANTTPTLIRSSSMAVCAADDREQPDRRQGQLTGVGQKQLRRNHQDKTDGHHPGERDGGPYGAGGSRRAK
jgi:hypothetical protein